MNLKMFVFHQGALGDFIAAMQALDRIAPKPRVAVCCQHQSGRLALNLGLADETFPLERGCFSTLFSLKPDAAVAKLLARYDCAILFTFSEELRHTVAGLVSGPVYSIPPRPPANPPMHIVDFLVDRIGACFPLHEGQESHYATRADGEPLEHTVLLHPGSGSPRKNWPLKKFLILGKLLLEHGLQPQWILGPAEYQFAATIEGIREYGPVHRIDDILRAVRLLRRAYGFAGNDSGLSHLAAFLGIPTVAVFGPSSPDCWAPRGPAVSIVKSAVGCEPCFDNPLKKCDTLECLKSIEPAVVLNALLSLTGYR